MEIDFIRQALVDIEYWKSSGNKQVQNKITKLLESIIQTPYSGVGKPEPLKHNLQGYWSRRITDVHRLVYTVMWDYKKALTLEINTNNW